MSDDACARIKADLIAAGVGGFTRFGRVPNIYIKDYEVFEGRNVFIVLKDGKRSPLQLVNGPVLFTNRSCILEIYSTNADQVDDIYDDIIDILVATDKGYTFKNVQDLPQAVDQFIQSMEVTSIL